MGFGFRIFFVNDKDEIKRVSYTSFERIFNRDPKEVQDEEMRVGMNMISLPLSGESSNVVHASDKFAQKTFKDKFAWSPSFELELSIIEASFL